MPKGPPSGSRSRGQVLVLFALMLVALLGMSALAIDVSRAYSVLRIERSVADSAALAGAQELQAVGTRSAVTTAQQQKARHRSLQSLRDQLGQAADPGCGDGSIDIVACPFPETGHLVSIKTPSPTCVLCAAERSVQVTVRMPAFPTTFARVLGQSTWNLGLSSVAGLRFAPNYGIVTLRPPNTRRNGTDANQVNIDVNGTNTRLYVYGGDVASNTSVFTNSGGYIDLEPGYFIYHHDDITPDPWNKDLSGEPQGRLYSTLIPDPWYPVPVDPTTTFADQVSGLGDCATIAPAGMIPAPTECYQPGTYLSDFDVRQNTDVAYLAPGVYSFQGNVSISGSLYGGRVSGQPGVVLKLRQDRTFAGNNAVAISINEGSAGCTQATCRAQVVVDSSGTPIRTPAGIPLSIVVPRDPACFSGVTPILCADNLNDVLTLPGNGSLHVTGVIYAPSDYVKVNGDNTTATGTLGQLIAWRISYSGGARLNQFVASGGEVGILRLDAACTATEPCNP